MARGWESKSVESQMEEAGSRRTEPETPRLTGRELYLVQKRQQLESSRDGVLSEIQRATHPRHLEQLKSGLAFLEQKLADLDRT